MKNILVPIDFSDALFNAVSYAAFLANVFNARLILVHAYDHEYVFNKNAGAKIYDSREESEEAYEKFLREVREELGEVQEGQFGAAMEVSLINEGPATFLIESSLESKRGF